MTPLPLEPVARNGGLGWREKRDAFGGRHQLLSACFSLLPSGRCPSPMHAVSWVIHQIGHCHQWSRDQWEHESNGINENSLKGIDTGVGKEGLSPSEFLYLGKYQGLGAPSLVPHAGSCLRKKASSEEKTREGIPVATLDFLDLAIPEAGASLEFLYTQASH